MSSPLWGDALARRMREEFGHMLQLESPVEMLPDDRNRVELDPWLRDYFGLPAPRISLDVGPYEHGGMTAAFATHAAILDACGATDVEHDPLRQFQA
ncbi:MAG TPA: hypothetical protein VFY16_03080, partial [Gemmatimonadaceae bacterium]|nr:hypothetical protein [Gemmatimonadaceae bacterium]